ncbi:hypothetical protein [Corynebacterium glutamicum]|uniref:hypothetical protein n=1 Tax=Corynebacterium glutamicum TaxID=1718 RepID=UPI001467E3B8|nr:hypothetical protein [Corynebacterium glutamicum]GFK19243.1 hypothetical protein KbCgl_18150 [Corynebacterium glutamicum]
MTTPTSPTAKKKPWYKVWWIWVIIVVVVGGIGSLASGGDGDSSTEASPTTTVEAVPEQKWKDTDSYEEYCTGDPSIDPELAPIVDAVAIPDEGHVWMTNVGTDSDNPGMNTVFFALCSPATGDDLKAIAEDLAIQVRASEIGDTVSEMGVNASAANPEATENIFRDFDFQIHLHDGGASRENGSYRAAWEARN